MKRLSLIYYTLGVGNNCTSVSVKELKAKLLIKNVCCLEFKSGPNILFEIGEIRYKVL